MSPLCKPLLISILSPYSSPISTRFFSAYNFPFLFSATNTIEQFLPYKDVDDFKELEVFSNTITKRLEISNVLNPIFGIDDDDDFSNSDTKIGELDNFEYFTQL